MMTKVKAPRTWPSMGFNLELGTWQPQTGFLVQSGKWNEQRKRFDLRTRPEDVHHAARLARNECYDRGLRCRPSMMRVPWHFHEPDEFLRIASVYPCQAHGLQHMALVVGAGRLLKELAVVGLSTATLFPAKWDYGLIGLALSIVDYGLCRLNSKAYALLDVYYIFGLRQTELHREVRRKGLSFANGLDAGAEAG